MKDLWKRNVERGRFAYLCSIKSPRTYYYHEWDATVDTDKEDDGECIIKLNTLLHCFYDGDETVYFLDSKGNVRMKSIYFTTHEFYMDYAFTQKGKDLKEPTIKKFIENLKGWYNYE